MAKKQKCKKKRKKGGGVKEKKMLRTAPGGVLTRDGAWGKEVHAASAARLSFQPPGGSLGGVLARAKTPAKAFVCRVGTKHGDTHTHNF